MCTCAKVATKDTHRQKAFQLQLSDKIYWTFVLDNAPTNQEQPLRMGGIKNIYPFEAD